MNNFPVAGCESQLADRAAGRIKEPAHESDNQVILARVPKSRIRERAALEFLLRIDASGHPVWTPDIARRGATFVYPSGCQRIDVVYNSGIKRYLMTLGYNHAGGWGVFDAPEPWGPWTTVFHTDGSNDAWGIAGTPVIISRRSGSAAMGSL